jgi:hypothetical protein
MTRISSSGEQHVGTWDKTGNGIEPLRADERTLKWLTLGDVARMAARREIEGWYVARCESKWTIGRKSGVDYLPVMLGSKAMTFDTMAIAEKYLHALLTPTGAEQASAAPIKLTIMLAEAAAIWNY